LPHAVQAIIGYGALMKKLFISTIITLLAAVTSLAGAENIMQDKFDNQPFLRWAYFSDQVMGGVSEGRVEFLEQAGESFARMTGSVSTENNGGFIQIRTDVASGSVDSAAGVYVKVRGNSQRYFVHLRTSGTLLPWQYYQAEFDVSNDWQIIRLPLSDFKRSGSWLRKAVKPSSIRSLGVLAYGREHEAEIDVAEIGFYQ
jgi:hypothetical protein